MYLLVWGLGVFLVLFFNHIGIKMIACGFFFFSSFYAQRVFSKHSEKENILVSFGSLNGSLLALDNRVYFQYCFHFFNFSGCLM